MFGLFRRKNLRRTGQRFVSASEIGSAAFCRKSIPLSREQSEPAPDEVRDRLDRGTRGHHNHGVTYDLQIALFRWGWKVLLCGALLAGLAFLMFA